MTTKEIHELPYKAQLYINELQRKIKDLLKIKKQIIMDKCKWNVKILNYYFRLTVENRFIILGYRDENWKELVNINFTLCIRQQK